MRSAPPVLVPVGRFVWERRIVLALALVGAVTLALAGHASAATPSQAGLWWAVWLLALGLSWHWSAPQRQTEGLLSWNGQAWYLECGDDAPVAVDVAAVWDLGSAMLLRVCPMGAGWRLQGHVWVAAERLPLQWHGLRCAVFARPLFTL